MDSSNPFALTTWILLFLYQHGCHARVNYDISECQVCSSQPQNLVPCKIQGMHDNCLSAISAIHGKQWPGPPRDLKAKKIQLKNETQAQFSWKPPYDASIHSLKGFLLRITTIEDYRGNYVVGSPWCFFLNLTNSSWADSPQAYDTIFQFNCIKSRHPAEITLSVSSIPRPQKDWQVVKQSVSLQGTVQYYNWKPNISVTETEKSPNDCVVVAVQPPFPNAYSHVVCLNLDHKTVKEVFFKSPNNNVTLCLSPGQNYSIQVKPYDKDNRPLSHYIRYEPLRIEPRPTTTNSPIDEKKQVMTWVLIPLILVAVISVTVFVFYMRGRSKKKKNEADRSLLPNNGKGGEDIILTIVFCCENDHVENIINCFGKIIRETTGIEVESVSDGRNIDPNRKLLFVLTEGIHRVSHKCEEGSSNNLNSNRAFSSGTAFLQRMKNVKSSQPLMVALSPIVSMNWLNCCIFKDLNVPILYHVNDLEQVELDLVKMVSVLECLCDINTDKDKIMLNLQENQEIQEFKNQLFLLYSYMRDNQKWFEDDFLGCCSGYDTHQTQPLLPFSHDQRKYPTQQSFIETYCLNNYSPMALSHQIKPHPYTQILTGQERVIFHPKQLSDKSVEKRLSGGGSHIDIEVFDSGISEGDLKLEVAGKNDGRLDSGVDSIPFDETSPFMVGTNDFFPPDSDRESIDLDGQSVGHHMVEFNKRNEAQWLPGVSF